MRDPGVSGRRAVEGVTHARVIVVAAVLFSGCGPSEGDPCDSAEEYATLCAGREVLQCVDGTWEVDPSCFCLVGDGMRCD